MLRVISTDTVGIILDIPKLPEELYEMIKNKPVKRVSVSPSSVPVVDGPATAKQLEDIRALCGCLSFAQIDKYDTWIKIGRILKKLGAPLSLWKEVGRQSKKFNDEEHESIWARFRPENAHFAIGSLIIMAKEGKLDELDRI